MGEETAISCVDTHVHYYPCFDAEVFLASLYCNLVATARKLGASESVYPVVCLLDSSASSGFASLAAGHLGDTSQLSWAVKTDSASAAVLHLSNGADESITVIGGRQVVTKENVELILLGCIEPVADGQALQDLLSAYQHRYGVILPWGFGKWLGKRGTIINQLFANKGMRFCLGDNAGRPSAWKTVQQFQLADQYDVPVVAGSDPLPISAHQNIAGKSAIGLHGILNAENPVEDLVIKIRNKQDWLGYHQHTSGLWRALAQQLAMRRSKRDG